ncbi:MAG: SLC13/DASS family transporter [Candidatus Eremiobacteraeota bacterium]|nr:SLC13/DASS family transporter [Candidatus Eremiobacteraeota bacterium]
MALEAVTVGLILILTLALPALTKVRPALSFLFGLLLTVGLGLLPPLDALRGFGNSAVISIACLYVVAAGVRHTGALDEFLDRLLKRPDSKKLLPWVTGVSSVINNTPVVGILIPPIQDWCRRSNASSSRLLLPLSYAASLGGMLTLFGTSTNLVVNELLMESGYPSLGVFEVARVGLPCAVVGLIFLLKVPSNWLPERTPGTTEVPDSQPVSKGPRTFWAIGLLVTMVVLAASGVLPLPVSAGITAVVMVATGCCTPKQALRSMDWSVLLLMSCALGLARAAQVNGLAGSMAESFSSEHGTHLLLTIGGLYLLTWILTEFLTNAAAAALMYPVALEVSRQQGVDFLPLALMTMVAASSSFMTPYGNQTNLMVLNPGGYKVGDYVRLGFPLAFLVGVAGILVTYFQVA